MKHVPPASCRLPQATTRFLATRPPSHHTLVLATGVFDLLHSEHQNFLRRAREIGDLLIVGLESDLRVKQIKGPARPIQHQHLRLRHLSSLPYVDHAFILPPTFGHLSCRRHLLLLIKPQILAISSHSPHQEQKKSLIQEVGGRLEIVYLHNPQVSTSRIIAGQTS